MCASNARTLLLIGSLPSSSWLFKKKKFLIGSYLFRTFYLVFICWPKCQYISWLYSKCFLSKSKEKKVLDKNYHENLSMKWTQIKMACLPVCICTLWSDGDSMCYCTTSESSTVVGPSAAQEKKRRRSETLWKVSTVTTVCAFYVVVLGLWSFCLQFYCSQKTVLLLASVLKSAFWTPILHPLLATHSRGGPQGNMHADTSARP